MGGGTPTTISFDTLFLLDETQRAINTFNFQTQRIHGIPLDEPGVPYSLRKDAIHTAIKAMAYKSLSDLPAAYQRRPRILLLTKGKDKLAIIEQLIPQEGFFAHRTVRDLADYGCPTAVQLLGQRRPIDVTASAFTSWFWGRYRTLLLRPSQAADPSHASDEEESWD